MRRRTILLLLGLLVISGALGVRAARHAAAPPFTIGVTINRRPRFRLQGVSLRRRIGKGEVLIRARAAEPGHTRLGHLALGPSTYLVLEDAEVEYRGPTTTAWTARGRRAELTGKAVEITDDAALEWAPGRTRRCDSILVDMANGRVSIE